MVLGHLTVVSISCRTRNKIDVFIAHPEARHLFHVPHIKALVIADIVLRVHRSLIDDNDVGSGVISAAKRTRLRRY